MEGIVAGERGIVVAPHGKGSAALVIEEVQAADKGPGAGVGHIVADNLAVLGHVFVPQAVGGQRSARPTRRRGRVLRPGYAREAESLPPRGKVPSDARRMRGCPDDGLLPVVHDVLRYGGISFSVILPCPAHSRRGSEESASLS